MNLLSRDKHVMPWRIEDENEAAWRRTTSRAGCGVVLPYGWKPHHQAAKLSGTETAELVVRALGE
jgi:hypothetical protein